MTRAERRMRDTRSAGVDARFPGGQWERRLRRRGFRRIAGLDEVGRGSLAGPVVAAAVVLAPGRVPAGLKDSKLLTPLRRRALMRSILRSAAMWSLGASSAEEIDRINIVEATRRAMSLAIEHLPERPDHLLIDALRLPGIDIPQTAIIRGDRSCESIAAASILAKVVRDRIMEDYDRSFPGFGFSAHKGYGTRAHLDAVARWGASPIHRLTFRGGGGDLRLPFEHAPAVVTGRRVDRVEPA